MGKTMLSLLPLVALSLPLAAPLSAEAGLPDAAAVNTALDDHPSVVTARAKVEAARAEARARAKGPHEITFSGTYNRRTIDQEGTFDEYDAQLSRAFRLPGKAELDRDIGQFGVDAAQNMAEDAKHQAALLLAGHWWDWLGASAAAEVDRQAAPNYRPALAGGERPGGGEGRAPGGGRTGGGRPGERPGGGRRSGGGGPWPPAKGGGRFPPRPPCGGGPRRSPHRKSRMGGWSIIASWC